jgi:hypothetical protein
MVTHNTLTIWCFYCLYVLARNFCRIRGSIGRSWRRDEEIIWKLCWKWNHGRTLHTGRHCSSLFKFPVEGTLLLKSPISQVGRHSKLIFLIIRKSQVSGNTSISWGLPDLNPLDIYLSGHLKILAYAALVHNEEALNVALWLPVRLSATTPASLNGLGSPWWDMWSSALNHMEDILSTYYKRTLSL